MRVILIRDLRQCILGDAIFIDVNLRNFAEQFREHEVTVFRSLNVIIRRGAKNIGAVKGRHRFLLFHTNDEDDIVKTAHDPLRGEQNGERTGSACGLGVHGGNAMQLRVDLRQKRAEMQLLGKLSGVEITDRAGVDFARIDLRVGDRFLSRLSDEVPDRLAFLLQVALKIGSVTAENINFVHTLITLANHLALSSRTRGRDRAER